MAVEPISETNGPEASDSTTPSAWKIELESGHTVALSSHAGRIAHTGLINDFIDGSYRFHYMQYTPWKTVNFVIVLLFVAMIVLLIISGVSMLIWDR